ncbi:fungal-specific transcription factor domain-containing protein [Aspergillus heterothallicus]
MDQTDTGQGPSDLPEPDSTANNDGDDGDREGDRDADDNSAVPGQTKCSICQSTFRRPEHLKRHFRSHTKEKPFECTQCGRHFSRTDTLHRHELSHHTGGTDGGKDRTHRITVKTFRACFKCALARVRCSGGIPCTRCENRSLDCQYPTERRSKAKTHRDSVHTIPLERDNGPPSTSFPSLSTQDARVSLKDDDELSVFRPGYQMGQFQLQITGSQNAPMPSTDDLAAQNTTEAEGESQLVTSPSLVRADLTAVPETLPQQFSSFASANAPFYSQFQTPNPLTVDQNSQTVENSQVEFSRPGHSVPGVPSGRNRHTQLGLSQSLLGQSAVSTINWLSNDLFLESAPEQSLTSGPTAHPFQTGVFDSSLNQTTWLPPVINTEPHASSLSGSLSQTPSGTTSLVGDVESPGRFVRGLRQQSLSHPGPSKRPTEYNTDEPAERLHKQRRKHSSWSGQTTESLEIFLKFQNSNAKPHFTFPASQDVNGEQFANNNNASVNCNLDPATYDQLYDAFSRLCCQESFLYPKFESDNFPDMQMISGFLQHYFIFYHPLYPMLHGPSFDPNKCHWILILALAAMGSHSAGVCEQNGTVTAFHEFLRRSLLVEKERTQSERPSSWLLQAMLLNCVGRLHGSSERGRLSALSDLSELTNLATCEKLLSRSEDPFSSSEQSSLGQQWMSWVEEEARRRTGYLIWLVDCTTAYQFDTKPHFSLDDGQAQLPCNDKIWQAGSVRIWKGLLEETSEQEKISLYDAVLTLYIEKKLVPDIGEFSHVLLIHALYHRMWEVGDYFRRPLSFWNPTAKKQSRKLAIPSGSVWLPGIPSYSKWRNSACDCLDILHWTANGTIAKANGHEHPTILHLHTARIILLAPFREIRLLVQLLATQRVNWADRQQVIEWHYVLRWIKHDQYKARLAVIHAGSVLYHVRKYSTNAFHEPIATYLAILTLWAYGICYKQAFSDIAARISSSEPSVITLDQPCSDELVQSFVREGQMMRGILTNAGDICAPQGAEQILRVGCETLGSLQAWGVAKEYMVTLMRLAEMVS